MPDMILGGKFKLGHYPTVAQIDDADLHCSTIALRNGHVTLKLRPPSLHINLPSEHAKRGPDADWWIARFTAVDAAYRAFEGEWFVTHVQGKELDRLANEVGQPLPGSH